MPSTLKGPGIFISQFAGDEPPSTHGRRSAAGPRTWATGASSCRRATCVFSTFARAAESKDYCDEISGVGRENGIAITELNTSSTGQLVAVNPAYDEFFDVFAPPELRGRPRSASVGRSNSSGSPRGPRATLA